MTQPERVPHVVVVGVDGSPASRAALGWAASYARVTGARVRAVTAWQIPISYAHVPDWTDIDLGGAAAKTLREVIADVAGDAGPEIEQVVVEGAAAPAVLEAAKEADLLVVGTRGRGGFVGLLLGSVSTYCVNHASCPVVVVPPESDHGRNP